jgi:hypothetical protein
MISWSFVLVKMAEKPLGSGTKEKDNNIEDTKEAHIGPFLNSWDGCLLSM